MTRIEDHPFSGRQAVDADVVVVGGGLAGLTAAAFAGRGGAKVIVLERAESAGGRAATHDEDGFLFNVGPHALYDGGPAARAFAELGVTYTGRRPSASGGLAYHDGKLHALPGGFVSLLTTDLVPLPGKLEIGKALGGLGKVDAASLRGRTLREWLDSSFRHPVVRGLIESLMRVTSYANDPARSCAAASVEQLQAGLGKGVLYLDGGWKTLVSGLVRVAEGAGVDVRGGQRVRHVRVRNGYVEIELATEKIRARVVVLAVPPGVAAALVEGEGEGSICSWAERAVAVKAACLDLGLSSLPDPRRTFALGIDRPYYFSVHSASAQLAPDGSSVVHVAKYLGSEEQDAKAVEKELEAFCDVVQPGWRERVRARRYLPSMMVSGALVEAGKARPGPEVPGSPSLLVAGDWVGNVSMIADTAVASGRQAGMLAAARVVAAAATA